MSVEGMEKQHLDVSHLPGIVIFVHGVNSDGEWYSAAEEGLVKGLNQRMGLAGTTAEFRPVVYAAELRPDGTLSDDFKGKTFISDPGRSPVIRFRWGYKAAGSDGTPGSDDEKQVYGSKIYLDEQDAWGGGPFQNGTSALPYMWDAGLDDRVFWWLYANMFPVDGREVYACPPRSYFAHAAHRLKELIKAIRAKQHDCPITVVCHSQGNMVTLAAALMGEAEGAMADTYVLCNPPYSLQSLGQDRIVNHDARSAQGQFGSVSAEDRQETFKSFLARVKACAKPGMASQPLDLINRFHGHIKPGTTEYSFKLDEFPTNVATIPQPGVDRDNRGRVFLYCNPHDQVIGVSPVEGIGWRGLDAGQLGAVGAEGVFHQRVWAMPGGQQTPLFSVGAPEWTGKAYRYVEDNHDPKRFWSPDPPTMKFVLSLNEDQGFFSKIITILTAPVFIVATRVGSAFGLLSLNNTPPKSWAVPITAPVLPEPVTPYAVHYERGEKVEGDFDQGKDPSKAALTVAQPGLAPDDLLAGQDLSGGQGNADTEASLRKELNARIRRLKAHADKGHAEFTPNDQREALAKMLAENPNATDHSTILTNARHAEKALAYDVAIGWLNPQKISGKDFLAFRQFANWMFVDEASDNGLAVATQFFAYWDVGWYAGRQLQRTYTMEHMNANAPLIADHHRLRSKVGYLGKGG